MEASLVDALMHRYGYRTPQDVYANLSRAAIAVLGEAIFWNHYTPPHDAKPGGTEAIQSLGIAVIEVD